MAAPPNRPTRRWLARGGAVAAVLLAPVLLAGLAELALRAVGSGHPAGFLLRVPGALVTNQRFGWRFFPRELARAPQPEVLAAPKPGGTLRLVVLGGSAAMGTPEPAFGFGRVLEAMLQASHPGRRFEVVNAAMTAINSHVVREIAADVATAEPDLLLVYLGNNEVVGPYGPGTVFQRGGLPLPLLRAGLAARELRIGQALQGLIRSLAPAPAARWQGMEMFLGGTVAVDDPRLGRAHAQLEANLEAIASAARDGGAAALLSTVAVNLADCPPFASAPGQALSLNEQGRFEELLARGGALFDAGDAAAAELLLDQAAAIDDGHAELAYLRGRCRLARGDAAAGRAALEQARDLDRLRFRADAGVNAAIRRAAARLGVGLVDAEATLARSAPAGVPGEALFYEHVHLTFEGNYRLAEAFLPAVQRALGLSPAPAPALVEVAERLVWTPWDAYLAAAEMTALQERPPFTGQRGHRRRIDGLRQRLRELRLAGRSALPAVQARLRRAREGAPDDLHLARRHAEVLAALGRHAEAAAAWTALLERAGAVAEWRAARAFASLDAGRVTEGLAELAELAADRPWQPEAHLNLATGRQQTGDLAGAEAGLREALRLDPSFVTARLALISLLGEAGRLAEARRELEPALRDAPDLGEVRMVAAVLAEREGRNEDAVVEYRRAVELAPDLTQAWNNLGFLAQGLGRLDLAETAYREALAADPAHVLARCNLADLLLAHGRPAEAAGHYRHALAHDAANLPAKLNLLVALRLTGREAEAAELLADPLVAKAAARAGGVANPR